MKSKKRVVASLLVFVLVIFIGVAGFKLTGGSDWTLLDSLYMTVITLSTVGYEEAVDINTNPAARVFTLVFNLVCLLTIAFAITSITAFIVEGELKDILGRRRMEKEIARLNEHYIVCGSDETAETVIEELRLTKRPFVVVEPQKERVDQLSSLESVPLIHGDPSEDEVLLKAGIQKAKGILLSLPTDEANLFVTLSARSLNPRVRIVTKGIDIHSHQKMKKAGADAVISPTYIGGMRMVSEMVRPAVVTFLDMMLRERERVLRFEEVALEKNSPLLGKTVGEAEIGEKTGALVVAVRRAGSTDYTFNPSKDMRLQERDILVLIAGPEMIREVEKLAGKS